MRTPAILLLIVLAISAVSAQSKVKTTAKATAAAGSVGAKATVPKIPAVTTGVKASGSAGVKTGVKTTATGSTGVKTGVKATVKLPTVKVTAKVPTVKASIGTTSSTHKVSSGKASTGISGGASIKVKIPSISLGASGSTKAAAVDLTGSCPHAVTMGFAKADKPVATAGLDLKICTGLTSTCCTPASINAYGDSWVKYTKDLSHGMWSIAKTNTAAANLISNLKTGFGDAAPAPAKAAAKRILQAMVAKTPAVKASAAGSVKGSVGIKATVPKIPAVTTGVKTTGSAGVKTTATGSAGVKTGVKVTAKVPTVKVTAKVPTVKASFGTSSNTHKVSSGKTSGSMKIGGAASTTGKTTIKISLKSSSKASAGPDTWNASNAANQALFANAWNYTIKYSQYSKTVFAHASACFKAILNLKASMACAACDNKNAKNFADKTVTVTAADTEDFETECSKFFNFAKYTTNMVKSIVQYVGTASGDATVLATSTSDLTAIAAQATLNLTGCVKDVVAPTKRRLQAMVPAKTPVTPAKTPVTPATGVVSATVTATSWTAWRAETGSKANTDDLYTLDLVSNNCLSSTGMTPVIYDLVYQKNASKILAQALVGWKALGHAYTAAGTTDINTAWTSFKGKVIVTSAALVKAATTKPAASTTAATTKPAATKRRLQAPVVSSTPTLATATTGISLKINYSKTGLTMPKAMEKDESQTQMASSKIAMFSAIAAFAMLFFN